jgi:hypothetical protein
LKYLGEAANTNAVSPIACTPKLESGRSPNAMSMWSLSAMRVAMMLVMIASTVMSV